MNGTVALQPMAHVRHSDGHAMPVGQAGRAESSHAQAVGHWAPRPGSCFDKPKLSQEAAAHGHMNPGRIFGGQKNVFTQLQACIIHSVVAAALHT
jgi:hypothetical protein